MIIEVGTLVGVGALIALQIIKELLNIRKSECFGRIETVKRSDTGHKKGNKNEDSSSSSEDTVSSYLKSSLGKAKYIFKK